MKLLGKKKAKKSDTAKRPAASDPVPAQPVMDGVRREAPVQIIDLSSGAFKNSFPGIAERVAEQRREHRRRRTQDGQEAQLPPADKEAQPPPEDKDEDT